MNLSSWVFENDDLYIVFDFIESTLEKKMNQIRAIKNKSEAVPCLILADIVVVMSYYYNLDVEDFAI